MAKYSSAKATRLARQRGLTKPADPFTYVRVGKGQRSDTCYAVWLGETFLGYVMGRDGLWDRQPEVDPNAPARPSYEFVYAQPSRRYVAECLAEDQGMKP